jgi:hypothetical protein
MKDNLHANYIPTKIVQSMKSTIIRGIIVKLRFWKTNQLTFWQIVWPFARTKYLYFWLPYKSVVDSSNKYSIVGGKSRDPYAMSWFEVKEISYIYKQGIYKYVFETEREKTKLQGYCVWTPFLGLELNILTRKKIIKMLDDFVFTKQRYNNKKPRGCGPK